MSGLAIYIDYQGQVRGLDLDISATVGDLIKEAAAAFDLREGVSVLYGGEKLCDPSLPLADSGICQESTVVVLGGSNLGWDDEWGTIGAIDDSTVYCTDGEVRDQAGCLLARLKPEVEMGSAAEVFLEWDTIAESQTRVGAVVTGAKPANVQIIGNNDSAIGVCAADDVSWHFTGCSDQWEWAWAKGDEVSGSSDVREGPNFSWTSGDVIGVRLDLRDPKDLHFSLCKPVSASYPSWNHETEVKVITNIPSHQVCKKTDEKVPIESFQVTVCFYDTIDDLEMVTLPDGLEKKARKVKVVGGGLI
eukprot:Hpha_TRINITY_DN30423_c0_g1::TRINITY_DN30423_c0_g1_i1::g.167985::m.167985